MDKVTNFEIAAAIRDYLKTDNKQYDYQREISESTADYFESGNRNGVVLAATGLGKTVTNGSIIKALITKYPDQKFLVLAPTKELIDQIHEEFTEVLGIASEIVGSYHSDLSKNTRRESLNKPILITTISSYNSLARNGILDPTQYLLASIDEAHKANGPQTKIQLSELISNSFVIAWTATDKFTDATVVGEQLFNKKNDDYIFSQPLDKAVEMGRLCELGNVIIRTRIDASDLPLGDLTEEQQQKLASRIGRDEKAIELSLNYVDEKTGIAFKDQTSIWYCSGVEHAKKVAKKLNDAHGQGYAEIISGKTPKNERKELLRKHKSGEIKALCNADLLIAGYNNKRASICYILRDVQSEGNFLQMVGRVTRLFEEMLDKFAFLVSLVDEGRKTLTLADVFGSLHIENKAKAILREGVKRIGGGNTKRIDYSSDLNVKDLITTDEGYFQLKKLIQKQIDERTLIEKPKGSLTKDEFAKLLKITPDNSEYIKLCSDLEKQFKANGEAYIGDAKVNCGIFKSGSKSSFRIHESAKSIFEEKLGITREIPQGYLRVRDFLKLLKKGKSPEIREVCSDLEKQFKANREAYIGDTKVNCGIFKSGTNNVFCIHESTKSIFEEKLGIVTTEKSEGYLSKVNFAKLIKTTFENLNFQELCSDLEKQFKANGEAYIGDTKIDCGIFKSGSKTSFRIHESAKSIFEEKLGIVTTEKPQGSLTKDEFAKLLKITPDNSEYIKLCSDLEEQFKANREAYIGDAKVNCGIFKSGTNNVFCIHESAKSIFEEKLGIVTTEKSEGYLSKVHFAKLIKTKFENLNFQELCSDLEKQFKANGEAYIGDTKIDCGIFKSGSKTSFRIHESAGNVIKAKLNEMKTKKRPQNIQTLGSAPEEIVKHFHNCGIV